MSARETRTTTGLRGTDVIGPFQLDIAEIHGRARLRLSRDRRYPIGVNLTDAELDHVIAVATELRDNRALQRRARAA